MGGTFNCSWGRLPGGRNCSCAWLSWYFPGIKSSKRGWLGCEGSRVIFWALFLTLDVYSSWRVGRRAPIILSAVRTVLCSLMMSDFVAEANQTVIDVHRTDSMTAEYNCFRSSCGRLKEVQSLLGLFCNGVDVSIPLQILRDGGSQESEWLHCCYSAVHDGEWGKAGGFLQKSMIISTVLSVLSSRLLRLHQTASCSTSCL